MIPIFCWRCLRWMQFRGVDRRRRLMRRVLYQCPKCGRMKVRHG